MFPPLLQQHDQFAEPMAETLFYKTAHGTAAKKINVTGNDSASSVTLSRFINTIVTLFIYDLDD